LVIFDGSESSFEAMRRGIDVAVRGGIEIAIAATSGLGRWWLAFARCAGVAVEDVGAEVEADLDQKLSEATLMVPASVPVRTFWIAGGHRQVLKRCRPLEDRYSFVISGIDGRRI
jgi:hypothetical protein